MFADDSTVMISKEGRLIQKKMSEHLKSQGIVPNQILHSPLKRTKETAAILGEVFHLIPKETPELGLSFREKVLLNEIPDPKLNQTIMMVGHAPTLLYFTNLLLGQRCPIDGIERSGVVILKFHDTVGFGKAEYVNYISPTIL